MSETYTVKQVAEILGYSTNSIYSFLKEGRIKGVRVGLGRFRITEEELKRLLHLSKKSSVVPDTESFTEPLKVVETIPTIPNIHFDITSLFDWFAGAASIIVGASLSLFLSSSSDISAQPLLDWVPTIQVSLILGGLGLIISDILTDRVSILWHRLFHLVLILTYSGFGLIGLKTGDGGITILLGTLAFVMILNVLRLVKGMESFLLFIIFSTCAIPLGFIIDPEFFQLPGTFEFILAAPNVYFSISFVSLAVFGAILCWSHYKKRIIFWACMAIYGLIFIILSFFLASSLMWSKSFFLLLIGLSCFLVPAWESLHLRNHSERRVILPIFAVTTLLLLFVLGVIYVMEQNISDYARREFLSKVSYAEIVVDSTLSSLEKTVGSLGVNKAFLESVEENDEEKTKEILKIAFEGNQFIKRLFVLNENGDLLSIYPIIQLVEKNFAFSDYFKEIKATRNIYISDFFEAKIIEKTNVIIVAGPILGNDKEFKGVVVSSIDLDRLSVRLQKIANQENGEYFELIDKNHNRIIHPDRSLIGRKIDSDDIVNRYQGANNAMDEGYDFQGARALQAFHKISRTGWYVELQAPIERILSPTKAVSVGFFSLISILVLAAGAFVVIERGRLKFGSRK